MAASIVLGFTAIRRRDIAAHRAWMIRAYALGLGAGTQVFTQGIGEALFGTSDLSTALSVSVRLGHQRGRRRVGHPPPAARRPAAAHEPRWRGRDELTTGPDAPAHYELRVEGHLDQHWSAWFGGLTLTHEDDGTTTLRGLVTDQAELHGLLAKVRDLGATLISVTPDGTGP